MTDDDLAELDAPDDPEPPRPPARDPTRPPPTWKDVSPIVFPTVYGQFGNGIGVQLEAADGLSLRDLFAAAALAGLVKDAVYGSRVAAQTAYAMADAMLAVRGELPTPPDVRQERSPPPGSRPRSPQA